MSTTAKKVLFIFVGAVAIYALLPKEAIALLGSFCIGWTLADIANYIFKD